MTYALFFAPAALVVAVLTLMVVPFLSLVVFTLGLLGLAAAGVTVVVKGLTAAFRSADSKPRDLRPRAASGQPAVGTVIGDSEGSLSCS